MTSMTSLTRRSRKRSPLAGDEAYILDACVVIDFCGRTDNLHHLMAYVLDSAVVTSAVQAELERQRNNFPRLDDFLEHIASRRVRVIDPDTADPVVARIVTTWSPQFGAGEVSSAALAIERRWVFISRDRAPMRELRLRETIMMQDTQAILDALVRSKQLGKPQAESIMREILRASDRRGRRRRGR